MKVKISYTVDISEVETEVKEILAQAVSSIESMHEKVLFAYNNLEKSEAPLGDINEALQDIRKDMYKADTVVTDCQSIMIGYTEVLEKLKEEAEDEET